MATPVDIGVWPVYRGDPDIFPITDTQDDGSGGTTPVDLTTFGDTWACQARSSTDSSSAIDIAVDDTNAATGMLALSLTGDQTAEMTQTQYVFDVQVSGGTSSPKTMYSGRIYVTKDVTRD